MEEKKSSLLNKKLKNLRNIAPTTFLTIFRLNLEKNEEGPGTSWFILNRMRTLIPCTHTDLSQSDFSYLMQSFILGQITQKWIMYIHLLLPLVFSLHSSARQPSQSLHFLLHLLVSCSLQPCEIFYPSAFYLFSCRCWINSSLLLLSGGHLSMCTFIHPHFLFQMFRGFSWHRYSRQVSSLPSRNPQWFWELNASCPVSTVGVERVFWGGT